MGGAGGYDRAVMPANPASLANLVAPFTGKGDPRNGPGGRAPNAGASMIDWYNRLTSTDPPISDDELRRIGSSDKEPIPKRQAAKSLLRSLDDEYAKNGRPYAADDLDRVLDRTEGKPTQRVAVETREYKDPAALRVELTEILAKHPELLASLGDSAARLLAEGGNDSASEAGTPQSDA